MSGIKEQLHGIRRRVAFLLYDNVGAIDSVVGRCVVCAKPAELGLNENSCENDDNFSYWIQFIRVLV